MDQKKFNLWFSEAQNDFEVGKLLIKEKKFSAASFYFVQAAEKAIKSLLYFLDQKPWGHSIFKLLDGYEKLENKVPQEIKDAGISLDPHYISSRYPDAFPDSSPIEHYTNKIAQELQKNSENIINFIEKEKEARESDDDSSE